MKKAKIKTGLEPVLINVNLASKDAVDLMGMPVKQSLTEYVGGGIPMNAWLMKGYFDTVPISLDESAKLDGAGHFRRFWQIVLPLVRPMIAVQALWAFMGPFGDYILSKFLLRDEVNYTVAVGLQTFISDQKNQKIAFFAAGAILIAVPICILFFFLQKNFVSGLTAGGDKG